MEIDLRQRQEFGERARVADDAQDGSGGAVATKAALAPLAGPAGQIDLANHPFADESCIVRLNDFADELVAGASAEAVISAPKLNVCVADSASEQTDEGDARWS